jgi:hypothetical protein
VRRYLIRRKSIFCGEFGFKRNFAPSKKRKILREKEGKKGSSFFVPSPRPLPYAPVHRGTLFLGLCFGRPALLGGSTAAAVQGGRVFLGVLF